VKNIVDLFTHSFSSIMPVFAIFLTGFAFGKIFKKNAEMLSKLAFWLFGTVLVFTYVTEHVPKLEHLWKYFLGTFIVTLLIIFFYWVLGKIRGKSYTLWAYTNAFSNTGYIGYPVLEYSIGPHAIPLAVIMASTNMVMLPTIGMSLLSSEKNGVLKNALKNMLKVPWLYAFIISWIIGALGFNWREDLPLPMFSFVEMLNRSAIPVILLVVGINLSKIPLKLSQLKQIMPASILKLMLPPAIALVVGKLIGMEGLVYQVFVLEIAMPTAANTAIMAEGISDGEKKEKELEFSSAVVVYSTFLFLFTYPFWFSVMS